MDTNTSFHTSIPAANTALPFTVAAALRVVDGWTDLTLARRRDLLSALSTAARMSGMPPDALLLTPAAIRQHMPGWSPAAHGISLSRMRNVTSAVRYVLRRLDIIDRADAPVALCWSAPLAKLDIRARAGLMALARFCSGRQITPIMVDHATLASFEEWLTARTLNPTPRRFVGHLRGAWNRACRHIADWPGTPVEKPRDPRGYAMPIAAFRPEFQADLAAFGRRLGSTALDSAFDDDTQAATDAAAGDLSMHRRPLRPSSIASHLSHARWAASALVATGVPVDEITSLADLVTPVERVRETLRFLHDRAGKKPSAAGHHVADVLRIIARHHARLSPAQVDRIRKWGATVALKYDGMTERNTRSVLAMQDTSRMANYLLLPEALMKAARDLRTQSPRIACALALRAAAIELLSKIPLRLGNVTHLRLDRHLRRDDPRRGRITSLEIPATETKNARAILMPVSARTAEILAEWTRKFRPLVAAPGCPFLFPGHGTGDKPITHQGLRDAIKKTMKLHVGVALTPHQFRHLAARTFLQAFPGHYEEVRQLLGHAEIATTVRHYSGIETEASARRFDEIVLAKHRTSASRQSKPPKPYPRGRRS